MQINEWDWHRESMWMQIETAVTERYGAQFEPDAFATMLESLRKCFDSVFPTAHTPTILVDHTKLWKPNLSADDLKGIIEKINGEAATVLVQFFQKQFASMFFTFVTELFARELKLRQTL